MWNYTSLVFALLIIFTLGACPLNPNQKETIQYNPVLLSQVKNGQKMLLTDNSDPLKNYIYIANLKGTPYEMGQAFGQLFSKQLKQQLPVFYNYFGEQLKEIFAKKAPKIFAKLLENNSVQILKALLDINVIITKKYTHPRYYQEISGIAKGANINSQDLSRLNIFPEFVKAACTVAGVWGPASLHQHTLHMRALDWDYKSPINKYPLITVYHPSNPQWQVHANLAWVGFVGSLTGISTKVSLGQKVWLPPKNSVPMTRYGNPWTYVFRDILYEATDLSSAIKILSTTHRTCAIHIGVASVKDHSFRMFQYSYQTLNIYDDKNYTHYNKDSHPQKQGIAYFDKHVQPSGDSCVGSVLTNNSLYGKWDLQSFWRILGQTHQTGDTQLVVFDLEEMDALVSYSQYNGTNKAFVRRPFSVDLQRLFAQF